MVIKLQDGSNVLAGDLLSGTTEDEQGKRLRFEQIEGSVIPRYQAKAAMDDGSNTTKIYTFDLQNTMVRISVSTEPTTKKVSTAAPQPTTTEKVAREVKEETPARAAKRREVEEQLRQVRGTKTTTTGTAQEKEKVTVTAPGTPKPTTSKLTATGTNNTKNNTKESKVK